MTQGVMWTGFNLFILSLLVLDLKVFNRNSHIVSIKEALGWSAFWIILSLLFNLGVYHFSGTKPAIDFLAGYLLEKSLSVDNLFVFILLFSYFKVPASYQHKVLFWGIIGALIMRALFIFGGIALISRFHWLIYLFGLFLVYTGVKLSLDKDEEIHPENNPILKLFRRWMPITENYENDSFFVRRAGKLMATPLFVVVLVVESTDVMFAVDSIPAIFAVTLDPFIVYTSNVFAILGLRALYFALAGMMKMFTYLNYGLSVILVFIGIKMLLSEYLHISTLWALGIIAIILLVSILASVIKDHSAST
ncbi:tellurite resistance protein TerC [Gammaproteobacteria bacterium]